MLRRFIKIKILPRINLGLFLHKLLQIGYSMSDHVIHQSQLQHVCQIKISLRKEFRSLVHAI